MTLRSDSAIALAEIDPKREFPFSDADFRNLAEYAYQHTGIALSESKRDLVYNRLSRRLRALGLRTFREYHEFLEGPQGGSEKERFINSVSTNHTRFFREAHHFTHFRANVAAQFAREQGSAGRGRLRVWSAGCSTGEEPYTIVMCLTEAIGAGSFKVTASDLDTQVIAAAAEGVYPLQHVQSLTPERQKRFFLKGAGRFEGKARVRPELAAAIEFLRVNLMDSAWPIAPGLDAIFCRNVMIYFDKATQRRLVERYAQLLRPGGLFFAGHAESLLDQGRHFRLRGQTVYELAR